MTTAVTKESLAARIAELESGTRSLKEDYTLTANKMLLATMEAEPVAYVPESQLNLLERAVMVEADLSKVQRFDEIPLYLHAQPAPHDTPALNSEQSVVTVPGKWIPVSERMPVEFEAVIAFDGDQVYGEAMYSSEDGFIIAGYELCDTLNLQNVTHWMPLPAAPQEVK